MLHRLRSAWPWLALILAMAAVTVVPALVFGQDTTQVPKDTLVVTPPTPPTGMCEIIAPYQLPLVQLISAGLLFLMASAWAGFAAAGDWPKRAVAWLAGTIVALVIGRLGCTPDQGLGVFGAAGLQGVVAAFVNWAMFKIVKHQPNEQPA